MRSGDVLLLHSRFSYPDMSDTLYLSPGYDNVKWGCL